MKLYEKIVYIKTTNLMKKKKYIFFDSLIFT